MNSGVNPENDERHHHGWWLVLYLVGSIAVAGLFNSIWCPIEGKSHYFFIIGIILIIIVVAVAADIIIYFW